MPLAFESLSHGTIAFGFFNIDSDMLLLDRYFFFADRFCELVKALAATDARRLELTLDGWEIADPRAVGDLQGAIAGVRHEGFIGALYRRYPFPVRREDFKQRPEGDRIQAEVAELIAGFGVPREISVVLEVTSPAGGADPEAGAVAGAVSIGDVRFSLAGFGELVSYVWRGGYPRWRDEERPGYVLQLRDALRGVERGSWGQAVLEGIQSRPQLPS